MTITGAGEGEAAAPAEGAPEGAPAPQEAAQEAPALSPEVESRMTRLESLLEDALGQEEPPEEQPAHPQQPQRFMVDPQSGQLFDRLSNQYVPDDVASELFGPEEMSPEQMQRYMDEQVEQRVAQAMQPYAAERQAQEFAALEEAYPQLRDPAKVQPIVEEAQRLAAEMGVGEAWRSARFIENVYLAQQARERAESEVPASGQAPTHEQPGAVPAEAEAEDYGDRIVAARPGGGFWM